MCFVVCIDDGYRDLSVPPFVIKDKTGYLIEFDDIEFVKDILDTEDKYKAIEKVSKEYNIDEDQLVTYTLEECKEYNIRRSKNDK